MALIRVADKDLMSLRSLLHDACLRVERTPCPRAGAKPGTAPFDAGRRAIKQLNRALKRIHGHDCCAEAYMPDPPIVHMRGGGPHAEVSYLCGAPPVPSPEVTFTQLDQYVTCQACLARMWVPPPPPNPNPLGRNYMSIGPMGPDEGADEDYEDM